MAEQIDSGSEVKESESTPDQKTDKKKGKGMLMLLIPAILIPVLVGGGLAYTKYETLAVLGMKVGLDFGTKTAEEEPKPVQYGEFMQIDGMIINPADSQGKRYLLVSVGLESHDAAVLEEVKQKEVVVRDVILKVLGDRTVDELANVALRNELKDNIRGAVNDVMRQGEVDRMYFTQYVLQ